MGRGNKSACLDPRELAETRKAAGLTQAQLAEAAGMARTNYINIENGVRTAGPRSLKAIATVLGVHPRQLSGITHPTLSHVRQWAGHSKTSMAALLGVDKRRYTRIENGNLNLTASQKTVIAKAAQISTAELDSIHCNPENDNPTQTSI